MGNAQERGPIRNYGAHIINQHIHKNTDENTLKKTPKMMSAQQKTHTGSFKQYQNEDYSQDLNGRIVSSSNENPNFIIEGVMKNNSQMTVSTDVTPNANSRGFNQYVKDKRKSNDISIGTDPIIFDPISK